MVPCLVIILSVGHWGRFRSRGQVRLHSAVRTLNSEVVQTLLSLWIYIIPRKSRLWHTSAWQVLVSRKSAHQNPVTQDQVFNSVDLAKESVDFLILMLMSFGCLTNVIINDSQVVIFTCTYQN